MCKISDFLDDPLQSFVMAEVENVAKYGKLRLTFKLKFLDTGVIFFRAVFGFELVCIRALFEYPTKSKIFYFFLLSGQFCVKKRV